MVGDGHWLPFKILWGGGARTDLFGRTLGGPPPRLPSGAPYGAPPFGRAPRLAPGPTTGSPSLSSKCSHCSNGPSERLRGCNFVGCKPQLQGGGLPPSPRAGDCWEGLLGVIRLGGERNRSAHRPPPTHLIVVSVWGSPEMVNHWGSMYPKVWAPVTRA